MPPLSECAGASHLNKGVILLCDDRAESLERWSRDLGRVDGLLKRFELKTLGSRQEFTESVALLDERRATANADSTEDWKSETPFDRATILVIDYDLQRLSSVTGERV